MEFSYRVPAFDIFLEHQINMGIGHITWLLVSGT